MADLKTATFGGGCFWCIEAVFRRLKGVTSVVSGYAGGASENPTYRDVCTGRTGHAEVVRIEFDAEQIPFETLLDVFWTIHDPTTLNRQGNDVGTQYRSVVFFHDEQQRAAAEASRQQLEQSDRFDDPIVTEISPLTRFVPAEEYHQDYLEQNPRQPYCQAVVGPKVQKFEREFARLLKSADRD